MYKGQISNFPVEVVEKMLDYQEEHGNKRDVTVFEATKFFGRTADGFTWHETPEGEHFWRDVIGNENFDLFFERYPRVVQTTQLTVDFGNDSAMLIDTIATMSIDGYSDEWADNDLTKVIFTFETVHIPLVKRVLDRMGLSYE